MNPQQTLGAVCLGLAVYLGWPATEKKPDAKPAPVAPDTPRVEPTPAPQPKPKPRRPWAPVAVEAVASNHTWKAVPNSIGEWALFDGKGRQVGNWSVPGRYYRPILADNTWGPKQPLPEGVALPDSIATGGPVSPDGTEVQCELPVEFRTRNIGSKRDGAGMCVTTSSSVAARWCGLDAWVGIRDWAAQFPGGSYPSKHVSQLAQYGKEKGLGEAPWVQYVGKDPGPFLDAVLGSGRIACVSWMNGGHWLNLVHLDAKNACIMDNNGDPNNLQWMTRQSCLAQINRPYAWCGCWLASGPPPVPHNKGGGPVRARRTGLSTPGKAPAVGGCETPGVFLAADTEGDEYTLRGRPATLDEVKAALGSPTDNRLTVIGTDAERKAVMDDLAANPLFAPLRPRLQIQGYAPDHWALRPGFKTDGRPGIYLQSPAGVVLARQDAYAGAARLAAAIRKADPNYDPKQDPDPSAPAVPGLPFPLPPLPVLALGAAGLFLLVTSRSSK